MYVVHALRQTPHYTQTYSVDQSSSMERQERKQFSRFVPASQARRVSDYINLVMTELDSSYRLRTFRAIVVRFTFSGLVDYESVCA